MFDVFYLGAKPNLFVHEKPARSLSEAQQLSRTRWCWVITYLADYKEWDWLWEPAPWQDQFVHAWPSQWQRDSGTYLVPKQGSGQIHYNAAPRLTVLPHRSQWHIPADIDADSFDFSWHPDPAEPVYQYVFGTQWYDQGGPIYQPGQADDIKYVNQPRAQLISSDRYWTNLALIESFDRTWRPHPKDPPYIYVFGNQWHSAEIMPTVEYQVPGATERKYMSEPRAQLAQRHDNRWHTRMDCDWDYSWCPDPGDPPYIYVFGNQWHPAEIMPTVEYHVPGATERKYMNEPRARLLPCEEPWGMPDNIDISNVDLSWVPDPGSPPYIYHFGSHYQQSVGLTYTVPGAVEIKFAGDIPRVTVDRSAVLAADIFYLDHSNAMSQARFERLQQRYPHIQKVRYVNGLQDTIRRCAARAQGSRFWVISSFNVYDDFDFAWHPETWQTHMTHVFGSQWNKWSDTFLINRQEFERHSRWAQDIQEFPNLNFVTNQQVLAPEDSLPIYVIDHGNYVDDNLPDGLNARRITRFYDSYLETLRRLLQDVQEEHIWVISTICDYRNFDFSWQPEAWQRDMLHVFASGSQKFGDTFYVPVEALRRCLDSLERLEWFETVNFCHDQVVQRRPFPVIEHTRDSHVDPVKQNQFVGPAAIFTNCLDEEPPQIFRDAINFWAPDTRAVISLDPGNQRIIVPRETAVHVRTQIYDYAYIDTRQRSLINQPLDVVFISNGEQQADLNYDHLRWAVERANTNRIVRVDGITGRVAAYHAAAQASQTAWFFAVFAKLEVHKDFDWRWQPDRMQQPKHYIFHARNPVNGLVYGHQAMIAYNKNLVLANAGTGLDFTLDSAHEVVPILSGTAEYAHTPWMAWRTAFREVIKLRASLPDVESDYRINRWCANGQGKNAQWSSIGAQDALEYYDSVSGDLAELRKSYEWSWLATYAFMKRGLTPGQR